MNITVRAESALEFQTPCLIVPVFQGAELSGLAADLNEKLDGLVTEVIEQDGFKAAAGDTRVLYTNGRIAAPRTILVGLGKPDKFETGKARRAVARAARAARAIKRDSFALVFPTAEGQDAAALATALAEGITLGLHLFNDYKTDEETKNLTRIENVTLLTDEAADLDAVQSGIDYGLLSAAANLRVRDWVNMPSNRKSPHYFALQAEQIAEKQGLRCEVWDDARIREERMGALYAVGAGSDNPSRFIILEYAPEGAENDAPFILVGKGMTFDSGGYSLKPPSSMEDMKDDMAGAAVVLAAMEALPQLGIKKRVIGLVASAENMVSGRAQRPGDIVTARNGKTIEVLNTDAEGRLILADALSYATELEPEGIIDLATLTGAIGIALGQEAAGLFSNDGDFSARVQAAGESSGDRVWPFPMWDEYKDYMKGTVSDLKNIGPERRGGSIAGAIFLEKFVGDGIPWAHLDIAAVSLIREDRPLSARGATGFGVRLLLQLLREG